jgi:Holliday junction resolvase RusA-like endonuclease
MGMNLKFFVEGTPAPKGSFKVLPGRGRRRHIVVRDNRKTKPWEEAVTATAAMMMQGRLPIDGPVAVYLRFILKRPKDHLRSNGELKDWAPFWCSFKPDLDKLARAVFDGLEGEVLANDSRVVLLQASKVYVVPGARTGCSIHIKESPDAC